MIPISLICKNFISFEELNYKFKPYPLLIEGRNESDDSQESNGSGKSALQAAMQIIYCDDQYIYMETENKPIPKKELVRRGQKESYLCSETHCPIRKQTLKIEKKIYSSKSAQIQVSVNNEIEFAFTDNVSSEANKFIQEWLGISKDDILNYYLISNEKYKSLFRSNQKSKLELINRFTNASLIDGVDDEIKETINKTEVSISEKTALKNSILGKIEAYNEDLEDLNNFDFDKDKLKRIELVKSEIEENINEIDNIKSDIVELKKKRTFEESLLKDINSELSKVAKSFDIKALNLWDGRLQEIKEEKAEIGSKISLKEGKKTKFLNELEEVSEILSNAKKNIQGAIKCPKCSHEFLAGESDVDIEEEKEIVKDAENIVELTNDSINNIKSSIKTLSKKIENIDLESADVVKKYDEFEEKRLNVKKQILKLEENVLTHTSNIENFDNKIKNKTLSSDDVLEEDKRLKAKIEKIKLEEFDDKKIVELKAKIKTQKASLNKVNKEIDKLEDEVFNVKQWTTNFKKFKLHLASKSLKRIQSYCNSFLDNMNSDLRIKMEGYKTKANGELKEEITPYIIRDGIRSFGSFSGGERARLEFSMILAIREMINKSNKFGGFDLLMIDEVLEGADALGLQYLVKSIKDIKTPILITTHVVDRGVSDNKLIVEKRMDISKILN